MQHQPLPLPRFQTLNERLDSNWAPRDQPPQDVAVTGREKVGERSAAAGAAARLCSACQPAIVDRQTALRLAVLQQACTRAALN